MSAMKRLFQVMADKKASDIFVSVGSPINIKINGVAVPVNQTIMTADTVKELLYQVLNERQIKEYEDLVTPNLTVHAFYVKHLLPIWFDVQCMERHAA